MNLPELRRLAEYARTESPWYDPETIASALSKVAVAKIAGRDAAFIAAASPDVVLGLLDRIKELEVERDARPSISVEDAIYFVHACQQSGMDDEDDDSFRVTWEALRAHAAKGGE